MSRATAFWAIGLGVSLFLMLFNLKNITPGLSPNEIDTFQATRSLSEIANTMVNAPYKTLVYITTSMTDGPFGLRLAGAIIGFASIIFFYFTVKRLCGTYIALTGSAMFATSTMLLTVSRNATPAVMMLSLMFLVGSGFYFRFGKHKDIAAILLAVVVATSLYVPGMIIFVLTAGIWQFGRIRRLFENLKNPTIVIASSVFGLLTVPLLVSIARDVSIWKLYLGLPETMIGLFDMLRTSGQVLSSIFVLSPGENPAWLGQQPVLDVFAATMFIYGVFILSKQYKLDRFWAFVGIFLITVIWSGVTGNVAWAIVLLPFIYLVIAIGLQNFVNKWFAIFPKNPIAKYIGSALVLIAVAISINFQLHRYFIAWKYNDNTQSIYTQQIQ